MRRLVWSVLAFGLLGCESKCDELVTVLTECVGDVGASPDEETESERESPQCSTEDEACATCVLSVNVDLCTEYGDALEVCRTSGECE